MTMEMIQFMAAPLAMCLVLVGLHVYFGLHIVRRGVIFVDIALAQSSALGAALAVALGVELGSDAASLAGVAVALLAAWLISLTRTQSERVPQEAFIGIIYVVASASTILVLTGVPHGSEEIKTLLVGSILWVTWSDVLRTAVLYALIGLFHYRFRGRFWQVTDDAPAARAAGLRVGWWDFLFYASLGLMVTRSVQVAGVLLVFTFLVVPAVMATLTGAGRLLLVGWLLGWGIAAAGALLSYVLDLPTGATIVCAFGVALALQATLRRLVGGRAGTPARPPV